MDDDDDINDHAHKSEITPMKGLDLDIFNAVAISLNESRSEDWKSQIIRLINPPRGQDKSDRGYPRNPSSLMASSGLSPMLLTTPSLGPRLVHGKVTRIARIR